jgi:heme-degrading monooxygenase HmoA
MIAVIFQVTPKDGRAGDYFELAGELRPEVEAIDGFISVERFESVSEPGKFVSLSFWRDAAAVEAWRTHAGHMLAQARGKDEVFADFRISVAEVTRDYTMADRAADRAADRIT